MVLGVVRVDQHPACTSPKVHALGCGCFAFLPAGICANDISHRSKILKDLCKDQRETYIERAAGH